MAAIVHQCVHFYCLLSVVIVFECLFSKYANYTVRYFLLVRAMRRMPYCSVCGLLNGFSGCIICI